MKLIGSLAAAALLAGAAAGCGYSSYDQRYYPRGYAYNYTYSPGYTYYPQTAYYYPGYRHNTTWDYYRNYNGIHSGPERTYPYM